MISDFTVITDHTILNINSIIVLLDVRAAFDISHIKMFIPEGINILYGKPQGSVLGLLLFSRHMLARNTISTFNVMQITPKFM